MAKLVKYIFIPILFVFLMSHNAFAVTTTLNMNEYDVINQEGSLSVNCEFYNTAQNVTNVKECTGHPVGTGRQQLSFLRKMESVELFAVKEGDIVEFDVNVFSPFPLNGSDYTQSYTVHLYFLGGSADFTAMEYQQTVSNNFMLDHGADNHLSYQSTYHVTYRARRDSAVRLGLTSSQHWFEWYGTQYSELTFAIYNVMHYRYSGSQVNKEQAQATQDAADESETEGGSSSSDAQQGTSSLLSAIGSAVSVISSASPTNCLLNGNMGNLDVGQIDLCANPVPTFVQIIGSIILILMVVPLCITLFNRFIGLFRSFQS